MKNERWILSALRVCLIVLFGILVLFQVFSLPGQFAHLARESPEMAYLRWPATGVSVFWVLCAQVVIVCTWKLLSMVRRGRIFTAAALGWVDAIIWTLAAGWALLAGVFLYVGFNAQDPGLPLLLFLLLTGGAVLGLLVTVLRALLKQATTLRADMDAVI